MARLAARNNHKNKPVEPDIQSIRKAQAQTARELAHKIDEKAFLGMLNDTYYYLVLSDNDNAEPVQELLANNKIQTKKEYRRMGDETILYLLDEQKKDTDNENLDEKTNNTNDPETK